MAKASGQEFVMKGRGRKFCIYHGDCVAGVTQRLEPGSVDVVVTSPP